MKAIRYQVVVRTKFRVLAHRLVCTAYLCQLCSKCEARAIPLAQCNSQAASHRKFAAVHVYASTEIIVGWLRLAGSRAWSTDIVLPWEHELERFDTLRRRTSVSIVAWCVASANPSLSLWCVTAPTVSQSLFLAGAEVITERNWRVKISARQYIHNAQQLRARLKGMNRGTSMCSKPEVHVLMQSD